MYELRHQRRFWNMFMLALRLLLLDRVGGVKIAVLFGMMHLAGIADRNGWPSAPCAHPLRASVTLEINRATIAKILDTRFAMAVTEAGGCAVDVDTEEEYDAIKARYTEWMASQRERAVRLYGALPATAGAARAAEEGSG